MKKILLTLLLFSYFASADEELEKKIEICQSLTDSQQRLSCYDNLLENKVEINSNENSTGKWFIKEAVSPIDDSKTVTLVLDADKPIQVRYAKKTPKLVVRCNEKETEVYIYFDIFLGTDTIYPITRIDSEKAVSDVKWDISTNHKAIFYSGEAYKTHLKVTDFLMNLSTKRKYFIQITPYGENPVNTTFTLTGLDEALLSFKAACGW